MNTFWEMPIAITTEHAAVSRRRSWVSILLAAMVLLVTLAPKAGGQGITGSITGTVTDPTGAPIAGASVTVREVDTNAVRVETTSDAGTYTVTQLAPGKYSVTVDKTAFKT